MEFNPQMLRIARESRGLSQKELAEIVSVEWGYISKIELGILQPDEATVEKLAMALHYLKGLFYQDYKIYNVISWH